MPRARISAHAPTVDSSKKRKRGEPTPVKQGRIWIAIDFGTTYTGCAWGHTSKPETINLVIQWPNTNSKSLEGKTKNKVPTEINYSHSAYKWGYQLPVSEHRHKWFKLDLDNNQTRELFSLKDRLPDPQELPSNHNLSPEKMTADYLRAIREHVEHVVLPSKISAVALASTPISYCLTIPVIWTAAAREKTIACAQKAGMSTNQDLLTITEPEAAAIYSLKMMDPHGLNIDDIFVVCDAGGGTVDLVSYRVIATSPFMKVANAVTCKNGAVGAGGFCGSTFIDRAFARLLKAKFEKEPNWDDSVLTEAMNFLELTVRFEASNLPAVLIKSHRQVKDEYYGNPEQEFLVPLSSLGDIPEHGVRRGKFLLAGTELHELFQATFTEIITLVKGQVRMTKKVPKAILLVGGFGQSSYLFKAIREAFESTLIEVLQSPNGWTAIVQGALMHALNRRTFQRIKVDSTVAKKYYGIDRRLRYKADDHDSADRVFSPVSGTNQTNVIEWFILKGVPMQDYKETIKLSLKKEFPYSSDARCKIVHKIYTYEDSEDSKEIPLYDDADGVEQLVELVADLSAGPISKFRVVKGRDGELYFKIEYEIWIYCLAGSIKFQIFYDKKMYGMARAENI